jgi:hypothetical protein
MAIDCTAGRDLGDECGLPVSWPVCGERMRRNMPHGRSPKSAEMDGFGKRSSAMESDMSRRRHAHVVGLARASIGMFPAQRRLADGCGIRRLSRGTLQELGG